MESMWADLVEMMQSPAAWIGIGVGALFAGAFARGVARLVTSAAGAAIAVTAFGFNIHEFIPWL